MLTNMTFQTFCVYYVGILHMYNLAIQQLYYMSANKVEGKRVGSSRRVLPTFIHYYMDGHFKFSFSCQTLSKQQNFWTFSYYTYMYYLCSEKYVKRGNLLSILVVFFDIFQRHICRDIINRGKKLYHFLTPLPFFYKIHLLYILPMIQTPKISFILSPIIVVEDRYSKIRFWGTRFSLFFAIFFVILKATGEFSEIIKNCREWRKSLFNLPSIHFGLIPDRSTVGV